MSAGVAFSSGDGDVSSLASHLGAKRYLAGGLVNRDYGPFTPVGAAPSRKCRFAQFSISATACSTDSRAM